MYKFLVCKTTALLARHSQCAQGTEEYEKLQYGVYVFYLNVIKTLVLLVLSLVLGIIWHALIFAVAYGLLRAFSFGAHLPNTFVCTVLGLAYFLISIYGARAFVLPWWVSMAIWLLMLPGYLHYAPAESNHRPIPERQRKPLKIRTMLIFVILCILSILMSVYGWQVYSNLFLFAAFFQLSNISPLFYRLFKLV